MSQPTYNIAPEIFQRFPDYVRGVLVFDQLNNGTTDSSIADLLRSAEVQARQVAPANVTDLPQVAAWRAAYRLFGAKPSEHRCSIEALLRRVTKPDLLPSINALVDIGNVVSLRYLLPAGVHPLPADLSALELRPARPGDRFLPSEHDAPEHVPAGEIVLAIDDQVLTRRWTWRQSWLTRTLPETTRVFFNIDGLPPTPVTDVQAALRDIVTLVREHCNGRLLHEAILSAEHPSLSLMAGSESSAR